MSQRSLHARFLWAVAMAGCALGVGLSAMVYVAAKGHQREVSLAMLGSMIQAVEKTAEAGAYARDPLLLQEIADGLARHPLVAAAVVGEIAPPQASPEASPASAASAATAAAPAAAASAPRAGDGRDQPIVATAARLPPTGNPSFDRGLHSPFDAKETIGRVRVWVDEQRLDDEARRQALTAVAMMLTLLATMLAVFNAMAMRMMSRPLQGLAEALAHLEPGTDARIAIDAANRDNELGTVAAATNRLLELQQQALARERAMRKDIAAMEARYRGIFDSTSAGLLLMRADGHVVHANPALARLLGLGGGELPPEVVADLPTTSVREPERLQALVDRARRSGQPQSEDLEMLRRDNKLSWAHVLVSVLRSGEDGSERIEGVFYDVTQRKLSEIAARHRADHDALTGLKSRAFIEAALADAVANSAQRHRSLTVLYADLDGFKAVNDRLGHAAGDAVLVEAARRMGRIFRRAEDLVGRVGGDELVAVLPGLQAESHSARALADQLVKDFRAPFVPLPGETATIGISIGLAGCPEHATDAAALLRLADQAMYAVKRRGKNAYAIANSSADASTVPNGTAAASAESGDLRDPLTGVQDRRGLASALEAAAARLRSTGQVSAVICMDIDQFRTVNLGRGTRAGDELLRELAQRLGASLHAEDTLARTGSDEFVAVLLGCAADRVTGVAMAERAAGRMLDAVSRPLMLSDGSIAVHASLGASLLATPEADPQDALREAQLALRRAKADGGNRLVVFEESLMHGFQERLALELALRAAVGTDQLSLHIQPQYDTAGRLCGGEALLRWRHPERGNVPPDQFIPLAEATGGILDLGRWVLEEGCRVLARMQRSSAEVTLSVNISASQFQQPDFVDTVRQALAQAGALPRGLVLEVTESVLIAQLDQVAQRMQELVAMGLHFSIDDFGTGFSGLAYLRRLPIDEIKIDRSFVSHLPGDSASSAIVQSILSMGTHLGMTVVAEGVETQEQSQFLRRHGCDREQGWLHGRPMPVPDWIALLSRSILHTAADDEAAVAEAAQAAQTA